MYPIIIIHLRQDCHLRQKRHLRQDRQDRRDHQGPPHQVHQVQIRRKDGKREL